MLKGKEKLNENTRIVDYQLSKEIYAEKQQNDLFIYLVLFNLCDKTPRVVVNLSILLNGKLRVTGVKQLIFNKANIAYSFLVAQDSSSATTAPESKEEALSVGWIVPGASS